MTITDHNSVDTSGFAEALRRDSEDVGVHVGAVRVTNSGAPVMTMRSTDTMVPKLEAREQHFHIASPHRDRRATAGVVLYAHGWMFSSALSIAHRFDGGRGAMNGARRGFTFGASTCLFDL